MSINRPEVTPEGAKSLGAPSGNSQAQTLRNTLGALLIAAGSLSGCADKGETGKGNTVNDVVPAKPTATATSNPKTLPEGEKPLDKTDLPNMVRKLFKDSPAYAAMEAGGSTAYGHFKAGDKERVIKASTDVEVKGDDITQVKCTVGDKTYTDLYVKKSDGSYDVMLDCDRFKDKGTECKTLKNTLPLTTSQKNEITFVNTANDIVPVPDETVLQIAARSRDKKPGCGDQSQVIATVSPTTPRTYTYVPPAPKDYISRDEYDRDHADQAAKDAQQDKDIASKVDQTKYDADQAVVREFFRCHKADGSMKPNCDVGNQVIANEATAPRK